ncbi:MAG: aminomethyl-transferring glycine dehydrogenase subunit GcvPB [Spirochaetaceae bacterium]
MIYDEPLLWEKSDGLGLGFSMPTPVENSTLPDSKYLRGNINLPGFSEPEVSRHFTRLSTWNYGLDTDIYPLGSCTMKYNPKIHEKLASISGFTKNHPLQSDETSQGSLEILYKTGEYLKEITGMDDVTLQPAAGAHGELVAMLMFKKYHESRGENRDTILIPDSAHGTNPASASLCGFKVKVIPSNKDGILTPNAVKNLMDETVAGIMITNPNTLGIFEIHIKEIAEIIHAGGGLVYADGANLNAIMGIVKMGDTGVDAMHLNLHKTFSTPHGGGGPGAGPVCVKKHLSEYLPLPRVIYKNNKYSLEYNYKNSIGKVHGFYGNFSVILKAYCYILSMGATGLKNTSLYAVLNANYIRASIKDFYHLPYESASMHEVLFTDLKQVDSGVNTLDIAKRLIENGIHPPTIYFPLVVSGAMLMEPTETESLTSLDNFIKILINTASEAKTDPKKLHNAPTNCKRNRVNETLAARNPILKGEVL